MGASLVSDQQYSHPRLLTATVYTYISPQHSQLPDLGPRNLILSYL